jgi:toxin ParE1/3/4
VADYRLTDPARAQVPQILADSEVTFGAAARARYAELLRTAFQDLADQPRKPSIMWYVRRRQRIGVYHVRHSRGRVPASPGRVGAPRHLIVFRVAEDGVVDVLGLMHERMLRGRALMRVIRASLSD